AIEYPHYIHQLRSLFLGTYTSLPLESSTMFRNFREIFWDTILSQDEEAKEQGSILFTLFDPLALSLPFEKDQWCRTSRAIAAFCQMIRINFLNRAWLFFNVLID